jgi:hopanoid-associated phosphorylase
LSFEGTVGVSGGVVAVSSLALEARIALGRGVSVICTQGQLGPALETAIKGGARGIISFGVAGGLAPGLAAGRLIVASAVKSGKQLFPTDRAWTRSLLERLPGAVQADILGMDAPVAHSVDKRLLHTRTGAIAVDMESHIAAGVAASHGLPFAACRVILDAVDKSLPPAALIGLQLDGKVDVVGVFQSVLGQPSQLRALVRTALDARVARRALCRARRLLGAGLGFPELMNDVRDASTVAIASAMQAT